MSVIALYAKVVEAKLDSVSPTLSSIVLRRCAADGGLDAIVVAGIPFTVPTHRLSDFLPGTIVTLSIHPVATSGVTP